MHLARSHSKIPDVVRPEGYCVDSDAVLLLFKRCLVSVASLNKLKSGLSLIKLKNS